MSGGSHDYAYRKVQDMAARLAAGDTALRRAFAEHLRLTAAAMKAVEWVDSLDWAQGDENDAIRAAMGEGAAPAALQAIRADMARIADEIRETLLEPTTAEVEQLRAALQTLAAFARTAPGRLPQRVQDAVDLVPWDGAAVREMEGQSS